MTANSIAEKVSLFSYALFRTYIFARLKVLLESQITKKIMIHSRTMMPQPLGLLLISYISNVTIINRILMSIQNSIQILVTSLSTYSWRIFPNSFWSPIVLRDMKLSLWPESPEPPLLLLFPLAFLRRLRSFYIAISAMSSSSFFPSMLSASPPSFRLAVYVNRGTYCWKRLFEVMNRFYLVWSLQLGRALWSLFCMLDMLLPKYETDAAPKPNLSPPITSVPSLLILISGLNWSSTNYFFWNLTFMPVEPIWAIFPPC